MGTAFVLGITNGAAVRRGVSRGINELYQNNHKRNRYNDICIRNIDKLRRKYLKTVMSIIISMTIANFSSVYLYLKYGQRVTITELKIPFIAEGSDLEFQLNVLFQIAYAWHTFVANIGIEGTSVLLSDGISLSSELIELRLNNLTDLIESEQQVTHQIKTEFLIILQQIDRVSMWIKEYYEAAYWRYFLSPTAFSYAIGISVYCQYIVSLCQFFLAHEESPQNSKIRIYCSANILPAIA